MASRTTVLGTRATPTGLSLLLLMLFQEPKRRFRTVARIKRVLKVEAKS